MKKRVLKFISKFFNKPIVQVGFYILGILFIFFISGVFEDAKTSWDKIVDILSAQETISVFLAGLLSLGMARLLKRCDYYLEESLKIDDDHHKIIAKYSGHDLDNPPTGKENYADKTGAFMRISLVKPMGGKGPGNSEKDGFSKAHQFNDEQIKKYKNKKLYLPSVTVFANTEGNTRLVFCDRYKFHLLPDYVISHADALLNAHKNSQKNNNKTIRLNDFTYDGKTLTLNTMRSIYYHMLMTNRCMDYDFSNGLTIRDLYEYDQRISPLEQSKLGNQIGINGLVLSSDGYVLIEKTRT